MRTYNFAFTDKDSLATAEKKLNTHYPNVAYIPMANSLQMAVVSENSEKYDSRIIAFIKSIGGELIDSNK